MSKEKGSPPTHQMSCSNTGTTKRRGMPCQKKEAGKINKKERGLGMRLHTNKKEEKIMG